MSHLRLGGLQCRLPHASCRWRGEQRQDTGLRMRALLPDDIGLIVTLLEGDRVRHAQRLQTGHEPLNLSPPSVFTTQPLLLLQVVPVSIWQSF